MSVTTAGCDRCRFRGGVHEVTCPNAPADDPFAGLGPGLVPVQEADADNEEIPLDDDDDEAAAAYETTVDGQPAVIDGTSPRPLVAVPSPTLAEALAALDDATTREDEANATFRRAKEGKTAAEAARARATEAVVEAARRETVPVLPMVAS